MKCYAKVTDVTRIEADVLAVFATLVLEKGREVFALSEEAKKVDRAIGGILSEVAEREDFEAKPGKLLLLHSHGKIPAKRVAVVGLGKLEDLTMADWQTCCATVGRKGKEVAAKRVAIALPRQVIERLKGRDTGQGAVEGMVLGTYAFVKHKSEDAQKKEKVIDETILLTAPGRLDEVALGVRKAELVSRAVILARDLVNESPSITTPAYLARVAKSLAKGGGGIACEVFGKKELEALGMKALLAVARGSDEEPQCIKLIYRGRGRKTVALVGKGITFDAGGLSLKSPENMETMKLDMAGAAAILGIFSVLPLLAPKATVVGLIAATENMPGPRALKPGDVVSAMNGKTIEVLNTDAEGRVVLADALSYASLTMKPDVLIDIATLTGACVVALGEEIVGLFSNNKSLAEDLGVAARSTGEKIWELPLAAEYKELLKSTIADIKNISGKKYAGAITAALFLAEFVSDSIRWAHLDIAGPAFAETDAPLTPRGGTGCGVRMILRYLEEQP